MYILVTGAAGYIGSVVSEELIKEGNLVIAVDNLTHGHREAVAPEAIFVQADVGNKKAMDRVFRSHQIEAVMHFAATTVIEFSMTDPKQYFQNNVVNGINLLNTMLKHNVRKMVFSSTAAVYGEPEAMHVSENDSEIPMNAYGESKLIFERILHWYEYAYGLRFVALRYFNVAGASERYGEDHTPTTALFPNILKVALNQKDYLPIFGTDYPTKDGSGIRDYIHILDLARAHLLVLKHIDGISGKVYNLGNGEGYSVVEVIEKAREITGAKIPAVAHPRRPGEPAVLVASSKLINSELGWQPQYPRLETMLESAWEWQMKHPHGYDGK